MHHFAKSLKKGLHILTKFWLNLQRKNVRAWERLSFCTEGAYMAFISRTSINTVTTKDPQLLLCRLRMVTVSAATLKKTGQPIISMSKTSAQGFLTWVSNLISLRNKVAKISGVQATTAHASVVEVGIWVSKENHSMDLTTALHTLTWPDTRSLSIANLKRRKFLTRLLTKIQMVPSLSLNWRFGISNPF